MKVDKHCSMCKFYQCVNFFMYCTKLKHRIKASKQFPTADPRSLTTDFYSAHHTLDTH